MFGIVLKIGKPNYQIPVPPVGDGTRGLAGLPQATQTRSRDLPESGQKRRFRGRAAAAGTGRTRTARTRTTRLPDQRNAADQPAPDAMEDELPGPGSPPASQPGTARPTRPTGGARTRHHPPTRPTPHRGLPPPVQRPIDPTPKKTNYGSPSTRRVSRSKNTRDVGALPRTRTAATHATG